MENLILNVTTEEEFLKLLNANELKYNHLLGIKNEIIMLEKLLGYDTKYSIQYYSNLINNVLKYLVEIEDIEIEYENENISYMQKTTDICRLSAHLEIEYVYIHNEMILYLTNLKSEQIANHI